MKNSILTGVLITLISSSIIGMLLLASDYYVTKAKQELLNKQNAESKYQLNRLYRVTVNQMNLIKSDVQTMDSRNQNEHEELKQGINELGYVISKNNKEMKKTLNEIKASGLMVSKLTDTNNTIYFLEEVE